MLMKDVSNVYTLDKFTHWKVTGKKTQQIYKYIKTHFTSNIFHIKINVNIIAAAAASYVSPSCLGWCHALKDILPPQHYTCIICLPNIYNICLVC